MLSSVKNVSAITLQGLERGLAEFHERISSGRLLFLSFSGSRLHGTITKYSDIDVKGVFLCDKTTLLLQNQPKFFRFSSGPKDGANSLEDVDILLLSAH